MISVRKHVAPFSTKNIRPQQVLRTTCGFSLQPRFSVSESGCFTRSSADQHHAANPVRRPTQVPAIQAVTYESVDYPHALHTAFTGSGRPSASSTTPSCASAKNPRHTAPIIMRIYRLLSDRSGPDAPKLLQPSLERTHEIPLQSGIRESADPADDLVPPRLCVRGLADLKIDPLVPDRQERVDRPGRSVGESLDVAGPVSAQGHLGPGGSGEYGSGGVIKVAANPRPGVRLGGRIGWRAQGATRQQNNDQAQPYTDHPPRPVSRRRA